MNDEPTVFVVDDDPSFRDSLRWLLESMNLKVEAYASAEEFLRAHDPARPGCLLLDVRMPHLSGLQLQEMLAARDASLPVIIVTGHGDIPMAVRAMKRGAVDFLEKPFSDETLLERVEEALAMDARRRREAAERDRFAKRVATLTHREQQVLGAIMSGRANKQIAADLGISVKTVEIHRGHVMQKMRAGSLVELTSLYIVGTINEGKPLHTAGEARIVSND